ncbi:class I SAM-dependent methyltransferase [Candidatus Dojkabacteria bacterium]|nr:class I SAM-dependent methyltransferase [Candidatus Dojkabacteria bacterium]
MTSIQGLIKTIEDDIEHFPCSAEVETVEYLESLVKLIQPKIILEIGTHLGYSTLYMLRALRDENSTVIHTIDITKKFAKILNKLDIKQRKKIIFHNAYSKIVLNELAGKRVKADLIFIDGNHEFLSVLEDLSNSLSIIQNQGIILFHDACSHDFKGVRYVLLLAQLLNRILFSSALAVMFLPTPENKHFTRVKMSLGISEKRISGLGVIKVSSTNSLGFKLIHQILKQLTLVFTLLREISEKVNYKLTS